MPGRAWTPNTLLVANTHTALHSRDRAGHYVVIGDQILCTVLCGAVGDGWWGSLPRHQPCCCVGSCFWQLLRQLDPVHPCTSTTYTPAALVAAREHMVGHTTVLGYGRVLCELFAVSELGLI